MRRRTLPRRSPLVLSAVALLALAASPAAAMRPVGPPIALPPVFSAGVSGAVVQPDGGFVVVYRDYGDASARARIFAPDGSLRRTVLVTPGPLAVTSLPIVAADASGGFVVAWTIDGTVDGFTPVAEGRAFGADGTPRSGILPFSRRGTDQPSELRLAVAPDGSFFVGWSHLYTVLGPKLSVRPYAADGTPLAQPQAIEFGPLALGDLAWSPARSELLVSYSRYDGNANRVYLRRYGADLKPLAPAQAVNGAGEQSYDPHLAVLADGRVVVVWSADYRPAGTTDVELRLFGDDGRPLGPARRAHQAVAGDQLGPLLAALPEGGFLVGWSDFCASTSCGGGLDGNDGDLEGAFVRHWGADGEPAGPDLPLPPRVAGWQNLRALAAGPGGAVAAYATAQAPFTNADQYVRRLESPCAADAHTLCLGAGRFRVRAEWHDFEGGSGQAMAAPRDDDWGSFWFFRESNVELVVKLLDGRPVNGRYWVFYASLSNVEYRLEVVDTAAGSRRVYVNPRGHFASRGDTGALPGVATTAAAAATATAPAAAPAANEPGTCEPSPTRLCLGDGRFEAEVVWRDFQGNAGQGRPANLTADTGWFWFFRPGNPELVVKVLDGRGVNRHHWVFYGALTNVAFELVVRDTATGEEVRYTNPSGTFASRGDTGAFAAR